jgi:hypothetical protein
MKILINPHIHLFHEIRVDVTFSSSLPPFPDGFHGTASILRYLELYCLQDDGAFLNTSRSIASTGAQFPALISLAIDGPNYYNACRKDSRWTTKYPGLSDLTISHYTPLPGQSFRTSKFLLPITLLPNLQFLNMADLTLRPSPTHTMGGVWNYLLKLKLNNIHPSKSIAAMLDVLENAIDITLTHCPIGDPESFNLDGKLTLQDIDAGQDLVPLLSAWEGNTLRVVNCPSFNDVVLATMGTYNEAGECFLCASRAHSLQIRDCLHFSGVTLRRLVAARLHQDGFNKFIRVEASGRAPEIAAEDVQWLSQNVNMFSYSPS